MPRIPDSIVKSAFYLYASAEDAASGRNAGGSGFIATYPDADGDQSSTYAVTNWHVAVSGGLSVIRFNRLDGGFEVFDFDPAEWYFLPGKYDVAAIELVLDIKSYAVTPIDTRLFLQNEPTSTFTFDKTSYNAALYVQDCPSNFGVGDDVFMMGLFVDQEGIEQNTPCARFGNISMLPSRRSTVKQPNGYEGISYIVDMHCRSGFSGSPVFVYRTMGSDLTSSTIHLSSVNLDMGSLELEADRLGQIRSFPGQQVVSARGSGRGRLDYHSDLKLLGILWGQFSERWEVESSGSLTRSETAIPLEGRFIKGMSGMSCVIPAWEVYEVLESYNRSKKLRAK